MLVPVTQLPVTQVLGPGDAVWPPGFGACWLGLRLLPTGVMVALTVIEVSAQLVVGAAFHHLRDVLGLLVDGHGPDDGARGRRGGHLDLDGACLGDLTVEFLQQGGILEKKREMCLQSLGVGKGEHKCVIRTVGSLLDPSCEGCWVLGTCVPARGLELSQALPTAAEPAPATPRLNPAFVLQLLASH